MQVTRHDDGGRSGVRRHKCDKLTLSMAKQFYHQWFDYYRVDVHGCSLDTAVRIVRERTDDCYRYGIPFLEVVHGSGDKANQQRRKSIGEVLREELSHPAISKKLPLSEYGYQHLWDGRSTALRLCLSSNPDPEPRSADVVFKGFNPEYTVRNTLSLSPDPAWQWGIGNFHPFLPLSTALYDVETALFGFPLKSHFSWECKQEVGTQQVASAIEKVVNVEVDANLRFERTLSLTPRDFIAIRTEILKGVITAEEIAIRTGCPLGWLDWCAAFTFINCSCRCLKPFKPTHFVNVLTLDGDCDSQRCYEPGSEQLVAELWQSRGRSWTPPKNGYSDETTKAAATGYCNGRRCKCPGYSICKQGEAKPKGFWSLWS